MRVYAGRTFDQLEISGEIWTSRKIPVEVTRIPLRLTRNLVHLNGTDSGNINRNFSGSFVLLSSEIRLNPTSPSFRVKQAHAGSRGNVKSWRWGTTDRPTIGIDACSENTPKSSSNYRSFYNGEKHQIAPSYIIYKRLRINGLHACTGQFAALKPIYNLGEFEFQYCRNTRT